MAYPAHSDLPPRCGRRRSGKEPVTEKRFGDVSEYRRNVYQTGDAKEQLDFLDHALERDFTTFAASDIKVENVDLLNQDFCPFLWA